MTEQAATANMTAQPEGTRPPPPLASRLPTVSESALRTATLLAFLLVLVAYFTARSDQFLSADNALNIVTGSSVIALVAVGATLVIVAGCFDLSVGGTVPLAGVVYATMTNDGSSVVMATAAVLLLGALCGFANGVVVAFFKINPLIATLATTSIFGGIALTVANGVQIPFTEPDAAWIARKSFLDINTYVWILFGLVIVVHLCMRRSVYGRYLYATGGNLEAARLAGIRVNAVLIGAYVVSGVSACLAGIVLASQLQTGSGTAGSDSALSAITAVILGGAALTGGVGGVPGTMIGVLILGVLSNGMSIISVPSFYQTIATGVVLLLAVGISKIRRVHLPRSLPRTPRAGQAARPDKEN